MIAMSCAMEIVSRYTLYSKRGCPYNAAGDITRYHYIFWALESFCSCSTSVQETVIIAFYSDNDMRR